MLTKTGFPSEAATTENATRRQKKPFVSRLTPDRSQKVRRTVQFSFLLLNIWIGVQFILWVRFFESQGSSVYVERPAGVDGWLPIAGFMNLRYFLVTRTIPPIHPSAVVLLCVFLLSSLLVKKSFCSWLCPVGTVSEYLWRLGRRLFRRSFTVTRWIDLPLRSLKHFLLAFFFFIVFTMSAQELGDFLASPFGIIADVKMLNFFRYMGAVGITMIAALAVLSVFVENFWCRFLCPYGALMGIVSALSPIRIRRDADACIDCGKCNKACPSHLPVDSLVQIRSVECTGCMECVAVCPAQDALQLSLAPRRSRSPQSPATGEMAARWRHRAVKPRLVAALLALLFFGLIGAARVTGHWQTNIPRELYMRLVPDAGNYDP
ncbi:MAG: 4Fe-4S binding protein [Terracidiphilus sp.]